MLASVAEGEYGLRDRCHNDEMGAIERSLAEAHSEMLEFDSSLANAGKSPQGGGED